MPFGDWPMSDQQEEATDNGEEAWRTKDKSRDAALVLPLVGAVLLLPPIIEMFGFGMQERGGLSVAIYLFVVWAGMIFCAWRISVWLRKDNKK